MKLAALTTALVLLGMSCSSDGGAGTAPTLPGQPSSTVPGGGSGAPPTSTLAPAGPVDPNELSARRLDQIEIELDRAEATLDRLERR